MLYFAKTPSAILALEAFDSQTKAGTQGIARSLQCANDFSEEYLMPTYCYQSDKTGQIIERVYPMGKAPKMLKLKTGSARRSFAAETKSFPPTSGWPMTCIASGVNASQADELREFLANKGVPTEVKPDGDPVYRDAKHRKKALKARGFVDKSSYI